MNPSITGHIASWTTTSVAVVAINAGARNDTYSTPPSTSADAGPLSTRAPTPSPMPSR